jgi:rubredoxin
MSILKNKIGENMSMRMRQNYEEEPTFWLWAQENEVRRIDANDELRSEALSRIVESVKNGEIISLDGIDSPLSNELRLLHNLSDFEMNSNWILSAQDWHCPCCERSKIQVSRQGNKGQILAKLVLHHDHMGEVMQSAFHAAFASSGSDVAQVDGLKLVERLGVAFAAYEEVLICEDCNNADAEAKKVSKTPKDFSFSIGQIKQFISSQSHQPHAISGAQANTTWLASKPAYELRMRLISTIANAAASDKHWYEPCLLKTKPNPIFGSRIHADDFWIQRWVQPQNLIGALGQKTPISTPNLSGWRKVTPEVGKNLPANYLAMLRSEPSFAMWWDTQPENWRCPICSRNKYEATYLGAKGKVIFKLVPTTTKGAWANFSMTCNHCRSTLMSLKWELGQFLGTSLHDSYSFVDPIELSEIIKPRAHSAHMIDGAKAKTLLEALTLRAKK